MLASLCYFFIIPVHVIIALFGTFLALFVRPFDLSMKIVKVFWLLMGMLMISGFFFTTLWSTLVYGNLYDHFDYIPGIDCSPFWLLIQVPENYYRGMTKGTIYALWALYALLCWGTAIGMTYGVMKRHKKTI